APWMCKTWVVEFAAQCGSPVDGTQVEELGLPAGCILVTRRQGMRETVPTATTWLEAGDRITAVVAPHASAAVPLLWEGCDGDPRSKGASDKTDAEPPTDGEASSNAAANGL